MTLPERSPRDELAHLERQIASERVARDRLQARLEANAQEVQALAASESRFRTIVEEQTELLSMATPEGLLTFVNPAYAQQFGRTPDSMIGTSLYDYIAEPDRADVAAHLKLVCEQRGVAAAENRMQAADGTVRWVAWTNRAVTDLQSEVSAIHSVGRDITENKRVEDALLASEARFRRLYESTPAMLHSIDPQGLLISVSDTWLATLGYDRSEVIGQRSSHFLTPASRRYAQDVVLPEFFRVGHCEDIEYQMLRKDGSVIDVRLSATLERDAQGLPASSLAVLHDVTDEHAAQSALRAHQQHLAEQHELLRVTLQSIADAVITTDAQSLVRWMNPVAERMTGWSGHQARGQELALVFQAVDAHTRAATPDPVATCLHGPRTAEAASESPHIVLISRTMVECAIEHSAAPMRNERGELLGCVLVFRDVSEQRRQSTELSYRARHDELTGLLNRREFETRLRRLLDSSLEDGDSHAMMYIDLDQFKPVNDACGHAAGDQLLRQISQLLKSCVRARDTLARLGGDEFGVLLEGCSLEHGQRVAQQICDQVQALSFVHSARTFRVGASIGLVPVDTRWPTVEAALQAADSRCYAAKAAGRNRVQPWLDAQGFAPALG